uniref:Putative site-specific tyrosine recombinase n=1 Tax=viral metagenome TaxID=1070528 RepID=A0A6M3M0L1_9ZZZZ
MAESLGMKTWKDAAERWQEETLHKRTAHEDTRKLLWIGQHLDRLPLTAINADVIRDVAKARKLEGSSPSTVNRYLALIRAVLRRAENEWEWLERVPRVRLAPEPKRRVRWITPDQARTLLTELPEHQRHACLLALATGLRQSNVLGLRWNDVDMRRRVLWVWGDATKNGEDIQVPLNDMALEVLGARLGRHSEFVLTYRGNRLRSINTRCWRKALKRAGILNFRWHDLRHTWASWLVQRRVPLFALQELGGWQSAQMVRRYAHLSPSVNSRYAAEIDREFAGHPDC